MDDNYRNDNRSKDPRWFQLMTEREALKIYYGREDKLPTPKTVKEWREEGINGVTLRWVPRSGSGRKHVYRYYAPAFFDEFHRSVEQAQSPGYQTEEEIQRRTAEQVERIRAIGTDGGRRGRQGGAD